MNRERFVTARDGLRLYARDWGDPLSDRPALLCLPGLTRNGADFARVARREAERRRVVCPDYRGRGRSAYDPDWRRYQARTYLDDLAQMMAALGLGRTVVLGTSMGGILAMGLAAMKPLSVAGVILNDIGPEVGAAGLSQILDYINVDRPQPDWAAAAAMLRRTLPHLSFSKDEDWLEFARGTYREGADGRLHFDWDVRLARAVRAAGPVPDLWPLFQGLGALPVLAVRGDRSEILSAATFERMAREKPDLVQVTQPGCGHAPSLDEPETKEALHAFLDRF